MYGSIIEILAWTNLSRGSSVDWNTLLTEDLQQWLLDGEPWTLYRTLTWLLGRGEDDESVFSAKTEIPNHPLIKEIFGELNDDGYWGRPESCISVAPMS